VTGHERENLCDAKAVNQFGCGSAHGGSCGFSGQRANCATRSRLPPIAQERKLDRPTGGLQRKNRRLRVRPWLGQRLPAALLSMRAVLVM
jgi:hypothetical protein